MELEKRHFSLSALTISRQSHNRLDTFSITTVAFGEQLILSKWYRFCPAKPLTGISDLENKRGVHETKHANNSMNIQHTLFSLKIFEWQSFDVIRAKTKDFGSVQIFCRQKMFSLQVTCANRKCL